MATTGGGPARITPILFTKREKYALVALSLAFIVLSGVAHLILGATGEAMFPKFKEQATPPPQKVIVQTLIKPPKKPTPTPHPTPTPPPTPTPKPETNTPPPIKVNAVKLNQSSGGTGPTEAPYVAPKVGSERGVPTAAPATPAPVATAVYAPQTVVDASFIYKCPAEYPEIAKQQSLEGTTEIYVTIGPGGNVISSHVSQSSGSAILDNSAVKAVSCSRFSPPTLGGKPATLTYKVIYVFSLSG